MSTRPFHFLVLGLAIAVLLWVTLVHSQSGQTVSNSDTGRFQLFESRYEAIVATKPGETGSVDTVGLFKIDTRTGETWRFKVLVTEGAWEFWAPISTEDPRKNEGE